MGHLIYGRIFRNRPDIRSPTRIRRVRVGHTIAVDTRSRFFASLIDSSTTCSGFLYARVCEPMVSSEVFRDISGWRALWKAPGCDRVYFSALPTRKPANVKMVKQKNHTARNNTVKAHKNGIKKPKNHRYHSTRGVSIAVPILSFPAAVSARLELLGRKRCAPWR